MKVVWITTLRPFIGFNHLNSKSGGWLGSMLELLQNDRNLSLTVLCILESQASLERILIGNVEYILLPGKNSVFTENLNTKKSLIALLEEIKPDVIDIQGIEFISSSYVLGFSGNAKVVATIQGLSSEIYKEYFNGLSISDILLKRSIRDWFFFDGIIERRWKYKNRGLNEIRLLKNLNYIIGRTEWDKNTCLKHNPDLNYYHNDRILRSCFYEEKKWDIRYITRYKIFVAQAHYPIKGFHIFLDALYYLVQYFPGIKVYISGKNMTLRKGIYNYLKTSGYQKVIISKIRKYNLTNNVFFVGNLNEHEVCSYLRSSHISVIPSFLENSPNALAEAQIIGTPIVASIAGGISSYVEHKVNGILTSPGDSNMLIDSISQIFRDDAFAMELSQNAISISEKRHDRHYNSSQLLKIYHQIIGQ